MAFVKKKKKRKRNAVQFMDSGCVFPLFYETSFNLKSLNLMFMSCLCIYWDNIHILVFTVTRLNEKTLSLTPDLKI